jgi:hypothetical protein
MFPISELSEQRDEMKRLHSHRCCIVLLNSIDMDVMWDAML